MRSSLDVLRRGRQTAPVTREGLTCQGDAIRDVHVVQRRERPERGAASKPRQAKSGERAAWVMSWCMGTGVWLLESCSESRFSESRVARGGVRVVTKGNHPRTKER